VPARVICTGCGFDAVNRTAVSVTAMRPPS
jgi:hypothetical protein